MEQRTVSVVPILVGALSERREEFYGRSVRHNILSLFRRVTNHRRIVLYGSSSFSMNLLRSFLLEVRVQSLPLDQALIPDRDRGAGYVMRKIRDHHKSRRSGCAHH